MSFPHARAALALLLIATAACGDPAPGGPAASPDPEPPPAAGPSAPPAAATATIPERFQGRWDAGPAACAGRPGEMRLTVAPDRLEFHESVARVVAVRVDDGDTVAVDLELEGEGERWRETRTLHLVGAWLDVTVQDVSATRIRCPNI